MVTNKTTLAAILVLCDLLQPVGLFCKYLQGSSLDFSLVAVKLKVHSPFLCKIHCSLTSTTCSAINQLLHILRYQFIISIKLYYTFLICFNIQTLAAPHKKTNIEDFLSRSLLTAILLNREICQFHYE